MDNILIKNVFAAVFDKKSLDKLAVVLKHNNVKVLGTAGTANYLKAKGVKVRSALSGFDFDGRVKSLDRAVFTRILADRTKKRHLDALFVIARSGATKQSQNRSLRYARDDRDRKVEPFDAVVVDLYKVEKKGFPESMDIGGQALIRAAVKNFQNVAVAFDVKSIDDLRWELTKNKGVTSLAFRKKQAGKALKFIAVRAKLEAGMF